MIGTFINRRIVGALGLSAIALVAAQAVGLASPLGTAGPLVPTGNVPPAVVAVPLQQNLTFAMGSPTLTALESETYRVQIAQNPGTKTVTVQWAVQTLRALGTLQPDAMDAGVTVVGQNAAGQVVFSRADFISTSPGTSTASTDSAADESTYTYSTSAPVSVWIVAIDARVNRTTALGSTYDWFAASDVAQAVN